jgi:hypothetical protein
LFPQGAPHSWLRFTTRAARETDINGGETVTWQSITSFTQRNYNTRIAVSRAIESALLVFVHPRLHHTFSRHHHHVSARGAQNGRFAAGNAP